MMMQMQAEGEPVAGSLGITDDAILRAIGRHYYLSARQTVRVLAYSSGSLTLVQSKLKGLFDAGFLQRLFLPRSRHHAGSSPFVYALAARGRRYLRDLGLLVATRYRPSEDAEHERSLLFLSHTLAVNDFLIAAELLSLRHPRVSLEGIIHERELRREPVYVADNEGRKLPIVPDGWLDLRLGSEVQMCLVLELDRGTVEQRQWRRKVRALIAYARGPYQERFGTSSITVAVVAATGERRLASLLRWTEAELTDREPEEADLFRLTALSPETASPEALFLSPVWHRPGGGRATALLEGLAAPQQPREAAAFP